MRDAVSNQKAKREDPLLDGYLKMTSELDREEAANEWCEGLVADAFSDSIREHPTPYSAPPDESL